MNIAEMIKQARERLGLTQEDLAEKLEVSRQAVSKWELGTSVPSPENLKILEGVLSVSFPRGDVPKTQPNRKITALALIGLVAGLVLAAVLSIGVYLAVRSGHVHEPVPMEPLAPAVVCIAFFDGNARPLQPDQGDGWNIFPVGETVLMVVRFQGSVDAVSLFLTPTGTETFDQREQLAVQAVYDGRDFALFSLDIPEDMMGHLDIMLESGGTQTVAETLNVAAGMD